MAQWILKANGRVAPRTSLRPLKVDELHSPAEIKKREVFNELIKRRRGSPMTPSNTQQQKVFEKYKDHEQHEHLKLKTLLTLLASSSTRNQHMTKLSMLKFNYNLVKKWSLAK